MQPLDDDELNTHLKTIIETNETQKRNQGK